MKDPYQGLHVDAPWRFPTSLPGFGKKQGEVWKRPGSKPPYPTMTVEEIKALPIGQLADRTGSHLYFWTTQAHLPYAFEIIKAWGFYYSTMILWIKKPRGRPGFPTWPNFTEYCLFCRHRRGSLRSLKMWPRNDFYWPRGPHSAKPPEAYAMFRETTPGRMLDVFARERMPGYDAIGNAIDGQDINAAIAELLAR
jgi:N6-adenosine-specific RNA methylase IME4